MWQAPLGCRPGSATSSLQKGLQPEGSARRVSEQWVSSGDHPVTLTQMGVNPIQGARPCRLSLGETGEKRGGAVPPEQEGVGNAGSKDQRVGGALPNLPGALSGSGESVCKCVCMTADTNLLLGGGVVLRHCGLQKRGRILNLLLD